MKNTQNIVNILELTGKMVARYNGRAINLDYIDYGVVLDFVPTAEQIEVLKCANPDRVTRTLFSVKERRKLDVEALVAKQILHYIEVYGLDTPGLFNLEVEGNDAKVPMKFISGMTEAELGVEVLRLAYSNAPLKSASLVRAVITENFIRVDFERVANNELRIQLFRPERDTFRDGADFVRWVIYSTLGVSLVIKNKKTIASLKTKADVSADLLERHKLPLAQVFNRMKPLILAMKNPSNAKVVNEISRLSKTNHKPLRQSFAKTFIADAYRDPFAFNYDLLVGASTRDLIKFLNLIKVRFAELDADVFLIRNGKMHVEPRVEQYDRSKLEYVERKVLEEMKRRLQHLVGKTIALPSNVDYGLPVSRKQTVGEMPFGTKVKVDDKRLSAGIYWENAWGARDLDLSCIMLDGSRSGWGDRYAYEDNGVWFSGDVTDASKGAMEFFTSKNETYALYLNVFSGNEESDFELIVGRGSKKHWVDDVIFRQRLTTKDRQTFLGVVKDREFIVYDGSTGSSGASFGVRPELLKRAVIGMWTIKELFDAVGIKYVDNDGESVYDYTVNTENMTFSLLEDLLGFAANTERKVA